MAGYTCRHGGARLAVVVVVLVVCASVAVLVPAIQRNRENARRQVCMSNLEQWGKAIWLYESAHRRLPMASTVTRDDEGRITAVDGWSFRVALLPYLDDAPQFAPDIDHGRPLVEPADADGTPHANALKSSFPLLICPSYRGSPYADPQTKLQAISNYKAMGATHHESLSVASPQPLKPKYGPVERHPDGAFVPGTAIKWGGVRDGTAYTIGLVETVEPQIARWTVGAEATLVGLSPDVEFCTTRPVGLTFYCPKSYRPGWGDENPDAAKYHTYLNWDYEQEPYDGADGVKGGKFGPGSHHEGRVYHWYLDGTVRSLPQNLDVSLYMFMITRDGHDPASEYLLCPD